MALSQTGIRKWYLVHKWTSLVCTVFLLLLCVTGLPLIFHTEIDALTRAPTLSDSVSVNTPVSLDHLMRQAMAAHAEQMPMFLSWDTDKPVISAITGPSLTETEHFDTVLFDARTGARLQALPADEGVMHFLLELHASLLLGLPGTLFLGLICVVFIVAITSGVVVYAPFMRKLAFGTVRKDRSPRIKWLDTHNMLGIVTTAWVSVVGITGFILTMELPITLLWQMDQLAAFAMPYQGMQPTQQPVMVDAAMAAVRQRAPDAEVSFIAWPGTRFSTAHHYLIALKGSTPLTRRLVRVAMVEADTGKLTDILETPWYVKAAFLSAPLHFGDYGGMPLKIIWALLDVAIIVVLITGLYLWLVRRRFAIEQRLDELHTGVAQEANT
jgi:uncharacterized iron-regulated membrane protein